MEKTSSFDAMLDILSDWGVKNIYGIPGGSINSLAAALFDKQDKIKFVQVRHEEVGALAASAAAKLTGKIGVCFSTAGPGAVHMLNGLYDAKMDKVPVLAIIGQVNSKVMNMNFFQEMNEDPIFADVAVYNRVCIDPNNLPYMVDDAVRKAIENNGVACITVPVDFGFQMIDKNYYSSANAYKPVLPLPSEDEVDSIIEMLKEAKRPLMFFGQGCKGAKDELVEVAHKFEMPMVSTVLGRGILNDDEPYYLKNSGRLGTKPAMEAIEMADLIFFVGSDFPFAINLFKPDQKFIQVDIRTSVIGKRHKVDIGVNADAKATLQMIIDRFDGQKPKSDYLKANLRNMLNWNNWSNEFMDNDDTPLRGDAIMNEINKISKSNCIFVGDVGNVTIYCAKLLNFDSTMKWTTSALYATMGYAVPGAIAAKLEYPDSQVFSISGDGGFGMVCQDILTQVKYNLPIINVVMSNEALGYILAQQIGHQPVFGLDLQSADFGAMAKSMGAKGYTVRNLAELKEVFQSDEVINPTKPIVIDVKITQELPLPVHELKLDTDKYSKEEVLKFRRQYYVEDMPTLKEILKSNDF